MTATDHGEPPTAALPTPETAGPLGGEAPPARATFLKAILTILFGLLVLAALIPFVQWVDYGTDFNLFEMSAPPAGAAGFLFGLLVVNLLVYALARVRALGRWQLVLLYVMLMTGLPVMNLGLVQPVFTNISCVASEYVNRNVPSVAPAYAVQHPAYYPKIEFEAEAPRETRELQTRPLKRFWSGTPLGLAEQFRLRDATVWEKFAYGWEKIPWGIWGWPLLNWGIFIFGLFLGILFLVEVLRQQWVERENLAFPLAALPEALIEERTDGGGYVRHPLLTNPLLWMGMAIPIVMLGLSGMRHYELGFERGELMLRFQDYFTKPPWDAIKSNILVFSPLLIGIGYLVHLEISRSVWIFFLLGTVFMMLAVNAGWNVVDRPPEPLDWAAPPYPFPRDQAVGAMLALGGFLLWRSRGGLWALVRAPFSRSAPTGGGEGFMPRRWAAWGFLLSFAFSAVWMAAMFRVPQDFDRHGWTGEVGSINGVLIVLWLAAFFLMVVAFARLRAEAGVPNNFLVPAYARVTRAVGGPAVWGWRSANFMNHYSWMAQSSLPAVAPLQLEGLAIARRHGPRPRWLAVGAVAAFLLALVGGGVCFLWNAHVQGEGYVGKNINWGTMALWVFYRARGSNFEVGYFHQAQVIAMVFGLGLTGALLLARSKWLRFPLHPLGYVIWCVAPAHQSLVQANGLKGIHLLWGPMLIAWFIKRTVIRYGGMKLYRKLLPIFLGMILGQLLMIVFWTGAHVFVEEMLVLEDGAQVDLSSQQRVYFPLGY